MISHFGTGFTYRLPGENIWRGCACGDRRNCFGCETYEKYKQYAPPPATNFDCVHRMSPEELARLFADDNCGYCHIHDFCFAKGCQIDCENMWLDWLKSPVEGG